MIDHSADRAVFRQLADLLRQQIENGDLAPGDPLPSELRLADGYRLSRTTVRQAIGQLRSEGLVTVDRPRGTFVRVPEPVELVRLTGGERVSARMPTVSERRHHQLSDGVPVLVVTTPDGSRTTYPADRFHLTQP
ncbi:winged helix-turn-helix domain-containing protein [Actinoplanes sp. G11-F43]|uniref:winged helix-turn-helix domain-containing protein n=1 Tax=Actinoplanes sp. G11-F43 TaxID=3424130 RepID=UPI003D354CD5